MINYLKVSVDGEEVPEEDIRFTPDRIDWFTQKKWKPSVRSSGNMAHLELSEY